MTELRTKAGRRMAAALEDEIDYMGAVETILEIEAEATAAAEQRLRSALRDIRDATRKPPINELVLGEHDEAFGNRLQAIARGALDSDAPPPRETPDYLHTPCDVPGCETPWHASASPRQGEPVERVEVRNNPDGTVDEVLFYVGDRCVFHLEQMDTGRWWFALYPKDDDWEAAHFDVGSTRRVWVADRSDPKTYPASMRSPALSEPTDSTEGPFAEKTT